MIHRQITERKEIGKETKIEKPNVKVANGRIVRKLRQCYSYPAHQTVS